MAPRTSDERLLVLEEKLASLDKTVAVYGVIFERNTQNQEKLSFAIERLTEVTGEIKITIERQTAQLESLQKEILAYNALRNKFEASIRDYENSKVEILELKTQIGTMKDDNTLSIPKILKQSLSNSLVQLLGVASLVILLALVLSYFIK